MEKNIKESLEKFLGYNIDGVVDYNLLLPIVRKINTLGKEYQFSIFKNYVSCTVEKSVKFRKDFSFSYAEYITNEQSDLEAIFKLIVKFVNWYEENSDKNFV